MTLTWTSLYMCNMDDESEWSQYCNKSLSVYNNLTKLHITIWN